LRILLKPAAIIPLIAVLIFAFIVSGKDAKSQDETYAAGIISGKVLDDQGIKIEGATITVKGQSRSAVSDKEDVFQIEAGAADILIISCIGYSTLEIPVREQKIMQVILTRDQYRYKFNPSGFWPL
jgi:hypothetical protein